MLVHAELPTAIEQQISMLLDERKLYASRVNDLAGQPDRRIELQGYLRMIENINDAAIRLARSAPCPRAVN